MNVFEVLQSFYDYLFPTYTHKDVVKIVLEHFNIKKGALADHEGLHRKLNKIDTKLEGIVDLIEIGVKFYHDPEARLVRHILILNKQVYNVDVADKDSIVNLQQMMYLMQSDQSYKYKYQGENIGLFFEQCLATMRYGILGMCRAANKKHCDKLFSGNLENHMVTNIKVIDALVENYYYMTKYLTASVEERTVLEKEFLSVAVARKDASSNHMLDVVNKLDADGKKHLAHLVLDKSGIAEDNAIAQIQLEQYEKQVDSVTLNSEGANKVVYQTGYEKTVEPTPLSVIGEASSEEEMIDF